MAANTRNWPGNISGTLTGRGPASPNTSGADNSVARDASSVQSAGGGSGPSSAASAHACPLSKGALSFAAGSHASLSVFTGGVQRTPPAPWQVEKCRSRNARWNPMCPPVSDPVRRAIFLRRYASIRAALAVRAPNRRHPWLEKEDQILMEGLLKVGPLWQRIQIGYWSLTEGSYDIAKDHVSGLGTYSRSCNAIKCRVETLLQ